MTDTQDSRPERAFWFHRDPNGKHGKLGGLPDLPNGMDWPVTPEEDYFPSVPLHFIGQIHLGELPWDELGDDAPDCPRKGILFFFSLHGYEHGRGGSWMEDAEDDGTCTRVLYAPEIGTPRQRPDDLSPIPDAYYHSRRYAPDDMIWQGVLPEHALSAKVVETSSDYAIPAPRYSDAITREEREQYSRRLGVPIPILTLDYHNDPVGREDWNARHDAHPVAMTEVTYTDRAADGTVTTRLSSGFRYREHQMFGLAPSIHSEVYGSTRNRIDNRGQRAIPLMTFDSDTGVHPEFIFCEGIMQFWIKPEDLAAGKFDHVYVTAEG